MIAGQIFPDDALLVDVAAAAAERGMFVISNGRKTVVSPVIPPGFFKVAVKFKPSAAGGLPCAA